MLLMLHIVSMSFMIFYRTPQSCAVVSLYFLYSGAPNTGIFIAHIVLVFLGELCILFCSSRDEHFPEVLFSPCTCANKFIGH